MNVVRFHDAAAGLDVIQVMPGTLYVTDSSECITTILGSCISVCLRDPIRNIGGLNHFMLPGSLNDRSTDSNTYGHFAMSELIKQMKTLGATMGQCEAKIFGGGCMFPNGQAIGLRNIEFTTEYLKNLDINITSEDVGLSFSRRIRFYNDIGKVMVKRLRSLHNKQISKQERDYESYLSSIEQKNGSFSNAPEPKSSNGA